MTTIRKIVLSLLVMALTLCVALGADTANEKKIQFTVTVAGITGDNEVKGEFSHIGPGARIDFNVTKWLMFSPEVSYLSGWNGGLSLGGTMNFKYRKGYVGLGFLTLRQSTMIYFAPGPDELSAFWKVHIGLKGRHFLIAFSYITDSITDPWIYGVGLTAGYIF